MPEPNSDQLALIAQADLDRLVQRVIIPALAELQPRPVSKASGPVDEETFFATAEAMTHNALCQEARRAFALTIGATFERQLRLWLGQCAPGRAKEIQDAQFAQLQALILEIKGVSMKTLPVAADIGELWEVVSAIRHGDGRATAKLATIAPHLMKSGQSDPSDIRFSGLDIRDVDLNRYYRATMVFWGDAGATPPLG